MLEVVIARFSAVGADHHETDLSAVGDAPQAHPRISSTHADARGTLGVAGAPRQGTRAVERLSTTIAAEAGLPRAARLQHREQFAAALAAGPAATRRHFTVFAVPNGQRHSRLGIIVGKKAVPRAVDRNRAKRLVRESFRVLRHRLGGVDIVVRVRRCPPRAGTAAARAELDRLLAGVFAPDPARGDADGH